MINWIETKNTSDDLAKAKTARQWNKDETYIGFLTDIREVKTPNGQSKIYEFEDSNDDGDHSGTYSCFWESTGLGNCMKNHTVGQLIRIDCLGEMVSKNKKKFICFKTFNGTVEPTATTKKSTSKKAPAVEDDFEVNWEND